MNRTRSNTYPCRWCGTVIGSLWLERGRFREYCSGACRQAQYRQRKNIRAAVKRKRNAKRNA